MEMDGGIPVFDGEGYEIWKKKMKTLFLSLELWDLVQHGYQEKAGENNLEWLREFGKKDNKALFLIQQGVSKNIFSVIMEAESSKEAWDAIRNKFDHHHFQKQQIEIEIADIKRGNEREILTKDQMVSKVTDITQKKCIFRVPDELRNGNEEFYEPKMVAIGPYHRGKPCLTSMEGRKMLYQQEFLQRTDKESVDSLVQAVMQHEHRVRKCYDKPLTNLNSAELAQIMVLDGCFYIELFCRYSQRKVHH
ncbi:uncharacterized protein LOC124939952 isoform X2 [Impatiens glandulifera]|uniref:uncharacterized protein LOC124939952 isoform X2 n=1 Tax=Impatiens glandulifera TaxID=253017 RepID=UPI001FB17714|nr:uncharacterized protein LOC124939952 isoform X2 [Impatiens glandulifera]